MLWSQSGLQSQNIESRQLKFTPAFVFWWFSCFLATLASLDESFGRVVKALSERDMLQNSIIVFSTDNGGAAGGTDAACNLPLRSV